MNATQPNWLNYTTIMKRQKTPALRQTEIPVEHYVSLPLPTKRWAEPGYAFFASPARRVAGQPMIQDAPDRWGVLAAHGGRLMVYALCEAISFVEGKPFASITV